MSSGSKSGKSARISLGVTLSARVSKISKRANSHAANTGAATTFTMCLSNSGEQSTSIRHILNSYFSHIIVILNQYSSDQIVRSAKRD